MPFDLDLDDMMKTSVEAERASSAGEGVPSADATPSVEADPIDAAVGSAESPASDRARGPDGKFKGDEAPDNNKIAADAKIGEKIPDQPVTEGIQTPVSWSAAAKAEFSKLPLVVQEAIAKREMEVSSGFKQYGEKVKTYEAIDKVLSPLEPALQKAGLTKDQYVQRLRAAEMQLESNPVEGIKWLAKSYGVDLSHLTGEPQQVNPEIASLRKELSDLRQWRDQSVQSSQTALETETLTAIERFKSDPKNEFFEQVRPVMGQLVAGGQAKDIADAYEKAVWMVPEVRQIMLARQSDEMQKKLRETATTKVAGAKPAIGVKGNGAINVAPTGDWTDTLRDVTKASFAN